MNFAMPEKRLSLILSIIIRDSRLFVKSNDFTLSKFDLQLNNTVAAIADLTSNINKVS